MESDSSGYVVYGWNVCRRINIGQPCGYVSDFNSHRFEWIWAEFVLKWTELDGGWRFLSAVSLRLLWWQLRLSRQISRRLWFCASSAACSVSPISSFFSYGVCYPKSVSLWSLIDYIIIIISWTRRWSCWNKVQDSGGLSLSGDVLGGRWCLGSHCLLHSWLENTATRRQRPHVYDGRHFLVMNSNPSLNWVRFELIFRLNQSGTCRNRHGGS